MKKLDNVSLEKNKGGQNLTCLQTFLMLSFFSVEIAAVNYAVYYFSGRC